MKVTAIMNYNQNGDLESVLLSKESFLSLISSGKIVVTAVNEVAEEQEKVMASHERLDVTVSKILSSIGVPKHIKGYVFLRDAVIMCINDFLLINNITRQLYPSIAREYNTTPSRVERAIRHAIESSWNERCIEKVNEVFDTAYDFIDRKPTNSEFIALIADSLRLDMAG